MQLKISSISNLTDARFFSAIGAHYLGFCFDVLNPNNISVEKAKEIIHWLHEPTIVGEFAAHQTKEEIAFIAKEMQLDEIQIPFQHPQKETLDFEKFLVAEDWRAVRGSSHTDFLVLNIPEDATDHKEFKDFIESHTVFLEIDIKHPTLLKAVETLQPYGIQISCRKEAKAGLSAVDEYAEVLETLGFC